MAAELGLSNIRYAGAQRSLNYYIGFSQDHNDPAVVDRFNARLEKMIADGALQDILAGYGMVLR